MFQLGRLSNYKEYSQLYPFFHPRHYLSLPALETCASRNRNKKNVNLRSAEIRSFCYSFAETVDEKVKKGRVQYSQSKVRTCSEEMAFFGGDYVRRLIECKITHAL